VSLQVNGVLLSVSKCMYSHKSPTGVVYASSYTESINFSSIVHYSWCNRYRPRGSARLCVILCVVNSGVKDKYLVGSRTSGGKI
jgi:hypothetical protein